jgi:Putative adhesin
MKSAFLKSIAFFAVTGMLAAQDPAPSPQRTTLPFSDPSRPKSLLVDIPDGSVKITGYDGNDAVIEYSGRGEGLRRNAREGDMPPGMHRLDQPANSIDATQENNVVRVKGGFWGRLNIEIKVPKQTTLDLKTMNGSISVEGISGEMTIDAMNGHINVQDASGPIVAHSMNGRIVASLAQVSAAKASSFSSMNGSIEVTLPADLKARLKMKTDRGEIYTDFDVKMDSAPGSTTVARDSGGKNGLPGLPHLPRLTHSDRTLYGTINGGGPEMQFITYNGRIVIRKK